MAPIRFELPCRGLTLAEEIASLGLDRLDFPTNQLAPIVGIDAKLPARMALEDSGSSL